MNTLPDIYAYLDYRQYLRDAFAALKEARPELSYRAFAREAGYTSPNYLQFVIRGERDLSAAHVAGTVRALGLRKRKAEYLAALVDFNQARAHEDKNLQYRRLMRARPYAPSRSSEAAGKLEYRFFEKWHNPVIRELLVHRECNGNLEWIAGRIHPRVPLAEVERSVKLLEETGLVKKDETTGKWFQTETVLRTPSQVASLAAANYQRSMIRLGSEAIASFSPQERDVRSVTLGISKSTYRSIQRRMESMWNELMALAANPEPVEEVCQVNLQLFPLTKGESRE